MRPRAALALLALVLAGCGDKAAMPYLGKWTGHLAVESAPGGTERDRRRSEMKGFLQLYATERRFTLHLEGEQQTVEVTGRWEVKRRRVTLRPRDVRIVDPGEDAFDPNLKRISPPELRNAYARPLVLDAAPGGRALTGLTTSVGPLIGKHVFTKGTP